jgi:hypothetical protein
LTLPRFHIGNDLNSIGIDSIAEFDSRTTLWPERGMLSLDNKKASEGAWLFKF